MQTKMKLLTITSLIFALFFVFGVPRSGAETHAPHWNYEGNTGPDNWATLDPDFGATIGSAQSPVEVKTGMALHNYGKALHLHYRNGYFTILNNGHTVQLTPLRKEDNYIFLGGVKYVLQQLHFHSPAEHKIDGVTPLMEAHFVHKSDAGRLAVMGMFFDSGAFNRILAAAWEALPEKAGAGEIPLKEIFNVENLLPDDLGNVQYNGSLTTPPTAEGVLWIILKEHNTATDEQIAKFNKVIGNNARPVQPVNNRLFYNGEGTKE
ncbi:MAG: carbonic anhydrase family protein [Deltaproteobacteria bacterium]|jgi:carbonic anhydrase|nr:carbonic anhydrase family protein [Deltaproteobacteria bacterium]